MGVGGSSEAGRGGAWRWIAGAILVVGLSVAPLGALHAHSADAGPAAQLEADAGAASSTPGVSCRTCLARAGLVSATAPEPVTLRQDESAGPFLHRASERVECLRLGVRAPRDPPRFL